MVRETCEEGNDAVVGNTVVVKKGDNLWKIAKKILKEENSGQTPSNKMIMEKCVEIACLNGMTGDNEFIIYPGQNLKVKSKYYICVLLPIHLCMSMMKYKK